MENAIHDLSPLPLAWDKDGMPFTPPADAVAWKLRRYTGKPGKPGLVWERGREPAHLALTATMDDLRLTVGGKPGTYWLYPVTQTGQELEPVAHVELTEPEDEQQLTVLDSKPPPTRAPGLTGLEPKPPRQAHQATGHVVTGSVDAMYIIERMLESRAAHDQLMAQLMTRLVDGVATIQSSTASLMKVANDSIKVASGLDALERLPEPDTFDADAMVEKLAELLAPEEIGAATAPAPESQPRKTIVDLIGMLAKSPIGMVAAGTVGKVMTRYTDAMLAQQTAAQAHAEAVTAHANAQRAQGEAAQARAEADKAAAEADKAAAEADKAYAERYVEDLEKDDDEVEDAEDHDGDADQADIDEMDAPRRVSSDDLDEEENDSFRDEALETRVADEVSREANGTNPVALTSDSSDSGSPAASNRGRNMTTSKPERVPNPRASPEGLD